MPKIEQTRKQEKKLGDKLAQKLEKKTDACARAAQPKSQQRTKTIKGRARESSATLEAGARQHQDQSRNDKSPEECGEQGGHTEDKFKHFANLNLTKVEKSKAFRKRSLLYHLDKIGGDGRIMSKLNQLWRLMEPGEILESLFQYGFDETLEFYNGGVPTQKELETTIGLIGPSTPETEEPEIEVDFIDLEPAEEELKGRQRACKISPLSLSLLS